MLIYYVFKYLIKRKNNKMNGYNVKSSGKGVELIKMRLYTKHLLLR